MSLKLRLILDIAILGVISVVTYWYIDQGSNPYRSLPVEQAVLLLEAHEESTLEHYATPKLKIVRRIDTATTVQGLLREVVTKPLVNVRTFTLCTPQGLYLFLNAKGKLLACVEYRSEMNMLIFPRVVETQGEYFLVGYKRHVTVGVSADGFAALLAGASVQ